MSELRKQVVVMRTDLPMGPGKMVSQGAHASMGAMLKAAEEQFDTGENGYRERIALRFLLKETDVGVWLNGSFTKVVLAVGSEEELREIYQRAFSADLPVALIEDNGKTVFNGVKTATCLAIGPAPISRIDKITGHLPLLK